MPLRPPRPQRTASRSKTADPPARLLAVVALGLVVAAAGCGTSGRDLREVPEGQTAPTRVETPAGAAPTSFATHSTVVDDGVFTLLSADFAAGDPLPPSLECGEEAPSLAWSNTPAGTVELALVATDSASGDVLWSLSGIPESIAGVPRGETPPGATVHAATDGTEGWSAPCPEADEVSTVEFTLYALPTPLEIDGNATGAEVSEALAARRSTSDVVDATYTVLLATAEG